MRGMRKKGHKMRCRLWIVSNVVLFGLWLGAVPAPAQNLPWLDIRDFGAVAGKESTAAIQNAVDTAARNGGGAVLIPQGTFRTGGAGITIGASSVTVFGMGEGISVIQHSGAGPAFTVQADLSGVRFADFGIVGSDDGQAGILLLANCAGYTLERVWIRNFANGTGISISENCRAGHIGRVEVHRNRIGISCSGARATDIYFSKIYNNTLYGIELTGTSNIDVVSTQVEKNGKTSDGASIKATGVQGLNISGCYNEQRNSASEDDATGIWPGAFLVLSNGTDVCRSVNVTGCRSTGSGTAQVWAVIEGGENISFLGNYVVAFLEILKRPDSPDALKSITWSSNHIVRQAAPSPSIP